MSEATPAIACTDGGVSACHPERSEGSPQPEAPIRCGSRSSDCDDGIASVRESGSVSNCHPERSEGSPQPEALDSFHPHATGSLVVVGLGPGGASDLTLRALHMLQACDLIVGYTVYVDLLRGQFPEKEFRTTPMRKEVERCRMALQAAAEGRAVAMVCSGDPGVYGMAGLVYQLAAEFPPVHIDVVPGVTAANGGAAVLGAPLMHDWCCISLSDLLTPWDAIEQRLQAAAQAGFVICLYNPASHKRPDHLRRACDVLLRHLASDTACGMVRNIGRDGEQACTTTLGQLRDAQADMFTTVYVGNAHTVVVDGKLVTPRGYQV